VVVAGKKITVDYYAPSTHGRKVMGGLVPYGQVWCTGANIATGFTTEADLHIGTLKLPKGTYSIWTLPTEKEWTLIVNKESGQFHLNYNSSLDFGRTKMNLRKLETPVETRPAVRVTAPVGMAAQLTFTKGPDRRGLCSWTALAKCSLPVPVSPRSKTAHSEAATMST
jgi:hypothetical protein